MVSIANDNPQAAMSEFRLASFLWMASGAFGGAAIVISTGPSAVLPAAAAAALWWWGKSKLENAEALFRGYVNNAERTVNIAQ